MTHVTLASGEKFDLRGDRTENFTSQGLSLTLKSDKSRYYLGEEIIVQCVVKNNGNYPITIYMHKNPLLNFTVVVRDQEGKAVPPRNPERIDHQSENQFFFSQYTGTNYHSRSIILQPGESLTHDINMMEYAELHDLKAGLNRFTLTGYFYPNPEQAEDLFLSSENQYTFFIDNTDNKLLYSETDHGRIPVRKLAIDPREVIYLALTAEYMRDWPNYFKFIDIHELIRDYPDYARRYMEVSQEKKGYILELFKNFLSGENYHRLLKFEVISENVENSNATVKVKATREIDGFARDFLYTYFLTAHDNLWVISGLETQLKK